MGKIWFVGDLHISDRYVGSHKDYFGNCVKVMQELLDKVKEARPDMVVFLGDLIGRSETNIRSRENLSLVLQWFQNLKELTRVVSVRGNHDLKGYPDFNLLEVLGLIETSRQGNYLDYEPMGVRLHFEDYKMEGVSALEPLELGTGVNVVIGHWEYYITGYTNWFYNTGGILLDENPRYRGVDLIVAGHIHEPSPEIGVVPLIDGGEMMLFYPGSPTRSVRTEMDRCYILELEQDGDGELQTNILEWYLGDASEIFIEKQSVVKVAAEVNLVEMAEMLLGMHVGAESVEKFLREMNLDKAVEDLILGYLQKARAELSRQ